MWVGAGGRVRHQDRVTRSGSKSNYVLELLGGYVPIYRCFSCLELVSDDSAIGCGFRDVPYVPEFETWSGAPATAAVFETHRP